MTPPYLHTANDKRKDWRWERPGIACPRPETANEARPGNDQGYYNWV